MAERVGFEPSRGELKARRAMPWKPARADKTECNEVLAERVGFEPTCRLPDKTLSRRPRYDHFGTSPCQNRVNQTSQYTARVANVWAGGRARIVSTQRSVRRRGWPWTCPRGVIDAAYRSVRQHQALVRLRHRVLPSAFPEPTRSEARR
jgi:hypothetical protein